MTCFILLHSWVELFFFSCQPISLKKESLLYVVVLKIAEFDCQMPDSFIFSVKGPGDLMHL
jgi:hypothetical protein